jgi:hypothetical protein
MSAAYARETFEGVSRTIDEDINEIVGLPNHEK